MQKRIVAGMASMFLVFASAFTVRAQEIIIPDPGLNAVVRETLQKPAGPLLQSDLLTLTNLNALSRNITNLQGLGAARNLTTLTLDDNRITNGLGELATLTNLAVLDLSENPFTSLTLPDGLVNLTKIRIENGHMTQLTLPAGLTKLSELKLGFNQLTTLSLLADMTNLTVLSLFNNQLTNLVLPPNLRNLSQLIAEDNQFSSLSLPAGLNGLSVLIVGGNHLTSFTVPADMTNLSFLRLNDNVLMNLTLPAGLEQLSFLYLPGNQLDHLLLRPGLTNLSTIVLTGNQLTNLTLPADMRLVSSLLVSNNPLATLVLSESLAASGLAGTVDSLRSQGVSVFTYPLSPRLFQPQTQAGAFQFGIAGPPGSYSVFDSSNLTTWHVLGGAKNSIGTTNFVDLTTHGVPQKFYRALLPPPPSNMVFIAPNTFTMGEPTNDFDRSIYEGPQATVTLTRGFWIAKHEVTQGEYLDVMGNNPSSFPGDLKRPISSVSWSDATNYCLKLTQRDLAAGRIPAGSHYRLPTEAEWECAARAGTSTRFSYGDDFPNYASLTNYAWFLDLGHPDLTVHTVGQKLPNPWGLYDMAGNVWEWCQDWYGDQSGGVQTDPAGPATNVNGYKVIRGGAYDYPASSARSSARLFYFSAFTDTDVGFRVVLEVETL